MYSKEVIRELQKLTAELIKKQKAGSITKKEIEQLRKVLRFHEHRYYVLNDPLMSDYEYDQLYKSLEKIELDNLKLITPDSPTQRIAKGLIKDFPKSQHFVAMLSLDNSYNEQDLLEWDKRCKDLVKNEKIIYCIEPKFDGASISLIYENNMLARATTRGDGVVGDIVTTNARQIGSIPLSADFSSQGIKTIEVRGEVVMTKEAFKKYNESLIEEGLPPLANPRNAAAGTLRIKNPEEVRKRKLEAFIYQISYIDTGKEVYTNPFRESQFGSIEFLNEMGFKTSELNYENCCFTSIKSVINHIKKFELLRDELPYEIDGMVVKVDSTAQQDKMGMTSHHPRWAIAFKFKARQATTKLVNVDFQVGRTGAVTPVAKLEPVAVGGVTISSISIHNEEYIKEKNLRKGDTVLIERAGDVIPQIVKSFPELRKGHEKEIRFPEKCPVCHKPLHKVEGEAAWKCTNYNCEAQVVQRVIHFASKDAMEITGLGEALVNKFHEMGWLKNMTSIYELPYNKIEKVEGFGKKSVQNLKDAIEKSKTQPLYRLIYGLGIRYVGETTAKTIANKIHHLLDLEKYSLEQLQELEDIGPKVAGSVHEFFHTKENIHLLHKLEEKGVFLKNEKKQLATGGNLTGLTFLFTGTLTTLERSDAEAMVEENGGQIVSGVSAKLNYLVVGEKAGSKLEKAKKINTVKIISEDEFLKIIGKK